jgi:hypothetical protein
MTRHQELVAWARRTTSPLGQLGDEPGVAARVLAAIPDAALAAAVAACDAIVDESRRRGGGMIRNGLLPAYTAAERGVWDRLAEVPGWTLGVYGDENGHGLTVTVD